MRGVGSHSIHPTIGHPRGFGSHGVRGSAVHSGRVGFGLYAGFGYYSPYYYPYYGSYGAYAYPSYYYDSYTYAPVYIESEETPDTYEDGAADVTSTSQGPANGADEGIPPDDERSIPDGVVVPRPLVEQQEAPEVLPPEEEEQSSSDSEDKGDMSGSNETRPGSGQRGVRT